jgi:DNA polymerase III sliding clamp (beta) subunit (PCNA family)
MRVMRALKAAKMPWLSHVVRLQLGTESLHLELSNRAPSDTEYARRTVALTADAATDATISVSLSLDYLIDAMRACVSDTVSIGATGALDPVKVTGGDAVCVVMPCRA